ncbi:MAG: hypothetical protein HC866_02845 [Leptolyngbyaceae cyanobacterium RU_5_1]|nr:hypothetical protein [Leptolyngbyaceae cyanobacterium RU_5_1]
MKLMTISLASLLTVLVGFTPAYAQQLSEDDRYELCSKSPSDSQCKGYQVPVSLDDRPGEAGSCVLTTNTIETETVCKLIVNEKKVVAYYEVGEKLRFLKKKKATQEIQISSSDIKAIRYREGRKDNSTARAINTALFGVTGFLFSRDKKVSEVTVDYVIPSPSDSTPGVLEPKAETPSSSTGVTKPVATASPNIVRVTVRRKTGEELRGQLEQLTGLKAEVPVEVKKPEQESSSPEENR